MIHVARLSAATQPRCLLTSQHPWERCYSTLKASSGDDVPPDLMPSDTATVNPVPLKFLKKTCDLKFEERISSRGVGARARNVRVSHHPASVDHGNPPPSTSREFLSTLFKDPKFPRPQSHVQAKPVPIAAASSSPRSTDPPMKPRRKSKKLHQGPGNEFEKWKKGVHNGFLDEQIGGEVGWSPISKIKPERLLYEGAPAVSENVVKRRVSKRRLKPAVELNKANGAVDNSGLSIEKSQPVKGTVPPLANGEGVLQDVKPPSLMQPIPNLAHGLDRVLFNPGVHWLQDPRSRVYNFTPALQIIPPVNSFDFERLGPYVKSSMDKDLVSLARIHEKRFVGSTSSLTGLLAHIYMLLSGSKRVNMAELSMEFAKESKSFSAGQHMPTAVSFRYNNGVYSIDSESADEVADKFILLWMGTMLEKFLTHSMDDFSKFLRTASVSNAVSNADGRREAYRYSKSKSFVMRSQLDCYDSRLPGTGVFDIKTRAALPLRVDWLNYKENSGYLIRKSHGLLESFEREYYDLMRSAFLKYTFQARIGNMDGVFMAYHNTERIFGFQYVPLQEMEERLYGPSASGEVVFQKCVGLLEAIAEQVVSCFPEKTVSCLAETRERSGVMHVWVQPEDWAGSKNERPLVRLDIRAVNCLKDITVPKDVAIAIGGDQDWSVQWSITRPKLSLFELHHSLEEAEERKHRSLSLPSGMSLEDGLDFWSKINWGADPSSSSSSSSPSSISNSEPEPEPNACIDADKKFTIASRFIKEMRSLSRKGRTDTKKWAASENGVPKVVWGQPDYVEQADSTSTEYVPGRL